MAGRAVTIGAFAKSAGVFRIKGNGAIEIGEGLRYLIHVPVGCPAIDQPGGQLRRVLGRLDQGSAGSNSLWRRERTVVIGRADFGISIGLRVDRSCGKCNKQAEGGKVRQIGTH